MHLRSRVRSVERASALVATVLGAGCIVPLSFEGEAAPSGLTEATGTGDAVGSTDEAAEVETTKGDRAESGSSTSNAAPDSDGVRLDLGSGGASAGSSGGSEPPSPPANDGDCCEAAGGTGCGDPAIAACVCSVDPVCCDHGWDALCVDHIESLGCGGCSVGPESLDVVGCCAPHADPSCADGAIAACVCAGDPYCCDIAWDQVCVDAVASTGCGTCDAADAQDAVPVADCCTPMDGPGCPDVQLEACVCALDPFCCETTWDELCADEAVGYCGACGDDGGTTGGTDGGVATEGSSSGTTD
jgi:hypothetical protein